MKVKVFWMIILMVMVNMTSLFANPITRDTYKRFVKEITHHLDEGKTIAQIELSDHTLWKSTIYPGEDYLLADLERDFYPGCEVTIGVDDSFYCLKSPDHEKEIFVRMRKQSKALLPRLVSLEKFPVIDSQDKYSKYICQLVLSDGSCWQAGVFTNIAKGIEKSDIDYWRVGNRIIVTNRMDENHWDIINIDVPFEVIVDPSWDDDYVHFVMSFNPRIIVDAEVILKAEL